MLAFSEIAFIGIVAVTTALIAAVCLTLGGIRARAQPLPEQIALLFENGVLHHASTPAVKRFSLSPGMHVWDDLRAQLKAEFPDFPQVPAAGTTGSIKLVSTQDATITLSWRDEMCWVHMDRPAEDDQNHKMANGANGPLQRCVATMAQPAWETDAEGRVCWCNAAYEREARRFGKTADQTLFADQAPAGKQRSAVTDAQGVQEWFEIAATQSRHGIMRHASCITELVHAEDAQRGFVQTLAKTFAHLTVGLAIFDKTGKLGMFNPALVDLSSLSPSFLASGPTMVSFFDALRENRRMPEPKNYRTWRNDIAGVIAAATDGQYHETWTLEDGRTYSVQGRAHPDGATAFLIEDISADITISRSYRAEVEQFEALLDSVDNAVVVFSAAGVLTFCNAAYRDLWGQNPEAAFADFTLYDAITLWGIKLRKDTDWSTLQQFCAQQGPREEKRFDLYLSGGQALACHISPLAADATLVRFSTKAVRNARRNTRSGKAGCGKDGKDGKKLVASSGK